METYYPITVGDVHSDHLYCMVYIRAADCNSAINIAVQRSGVNKYAEWPYLLHVGHHGHFGAIAKGWVAAVHKRKSRYCNYHLCHICGACSIGTSYWSGLWVC